MRKRLGSIVFAVLAVGATGEADMPPCAYNFDCPPTYFLVAEMEPYHNDSYALLLTDPWIVSGAYMVAEFGCGSVCIVHAYADLWDPKDGINLNRNYLDQNAPSWSWYVTEFIEFAQVAIELCDGSPTLTEEHEEDEICYWRYTIVAALGTELDPWCYALKPDCVADLNDLRIIASHWLESGCEYPGWCGGADVNVSGEVDWVDFALLAEKWQLGN